MNARHAALAALLLAGPAWAQEPPDAAALADCGGLFLAEREVSGATTGDPEWAELTAAMREMHERAAVRLLASGEETEVSAASDRALEMAAEAYARHRPILRDGGAEAEAARAACAALRED